MNHTNEISNPDQWPADSDARIEAPEQHDLLMENERVRVLDTRIRAGDSTPVHTHRWPSVFYMMSWSNFVRYDAEGNVMFDSRTLDIPPAVGTAIWSEPLGPHYVENIGTRDLRVISVELKESAVE